MTKICRSRKPLRMHLKKRILLKDLARDAGVSISTVSRALRNDPQIPEATCRRIQQVAENMGYRTNPFIANLMANIRRGDAENARIPLGLIVETRNHYFIETNYYTRCIKGLEARAETLGYYLVHIPVKEDALRSIRAGLHMLRSRGIRGVIVAPLYIPGCDFSDIDWSGLATVTIGHSLAQPRMHRIATNDYFTIQRVLEELQPSKMNRIGYCMLRSTDSILNRAWLAGFKAYQHELPKREVIPVYQDDGFYREDRFRNWFTKYRPNVIINCRSVLSNWIQEWGFRIPEDVAMIDLNRTSERFAGIEQRIEIIGATAIDALVAQIHRNEFKLPSFGIETLIEGQWVEGRSFPPAEDSRATHTSDNTITR